MSAPKRILLLDTGNEWGGGTNSMFELLKRIDRQRFDVTCCFYKDYYKGNNGRLLSEELADIGIPLLILPTTRQPPWAKLTKEILRGMLFWSGSLKKNAIRKIDYLWRIKPRAEALKKLLQEKSFDLLYMNNQPASNLEGYLAAEMAHLPVVQHCRIEPNLLPADMAIVNRTATRIICVSHGVADVLKTAQVISERLRVVPNAIDCDAPLPQPISLPERKEQLVIGSVGQLTERKGIHHLLQALSKLKNEGLTPSCLIIGEGPQQAALHELTEQLQLQTQVIFTGFQSAPLAWVQAMDVCVLCSSKEGLPRVVLEAMLSRKPVIGSAVTGTKELIVHEETGLLFPYGDIPALTAALRRLLQAPEERQRMGEAGRARVVEHYSINAYVHGVSEVLNEALS